MKESSERSMPCMEDSESNHVFTRTSFAHACDGPDARHAPMVSSRAEWRSDPKSGAFAQRRRRRGGARSSRAQRDSSYTRSQGYDGKSFGVSFKTPASRVWGELQTLMKSEHDVRTALGANMYKSGNETRKKSEHDVRTALGATATRNETHK